MFAVLEEFREGGKERAEGSVVRGDGVAVARTRPLITLACMLLAEQLVCHPEVAAHLQVEAAV